jgi:hypothetical protein
VRHTMEIASTEIVGLWDASRRAFGGILTDYG